jgi:hypothetical protein
MYCLCEEEAEYLNIAVKVIHQVCSKLSFCYPDFESVNWDEQFCLRVRNSCYTVWRRSRLTRFIEVASVMVVITGSFVS